ncbi:hypothetical protein BU15DRAFT_67342 [Melanogaster broomeanus]|nr:hypothetical protein BU15DRAFT_67342 [Melanogaster broomeanus]
MDLRCWKCDDPEKDVPPRESTGQQPYVVVVFGQTGVGVSSLVNLIAGTPLSAFHPDTKTCTSKSKRHEFNLPGYDTQVCLYEVPGFGGGVRDSTLLKEICRLEKERPIDLFMYCLRKKSSTVLPNIVQQIRADVPGRTMIAVVTELEKFEGDMEAWWNTSLEEGKTNGKTLESKGMMFDAHVCVTTLPPKDTALVEALRKRRDHSEEVVRRLIVDKCRRAHGN